MQRLSDHITDHVRKMGKTDRNREFHRIIDAWEHPEITPNMSKRTRQVIIAHSLQSLFNVVPETILHWCTPGTKRAIPAKHLVRLLDAERQGALVQTDTPRSTALALQDFVARETYLKYAETYPKQLAEIPWCLT